MFSLAYYSEGVGRSGKNTHIIMISNSVTHLQSFTNTAIAEIAKNADGAPETPRGMPETPRWAPLLAHRAQHRWWLPLETRLFYEFFTVFHDVLQCFTSVSQCFMMFHKCFMMFYECFTMFYEFHYVLRVFHNVLWVFHDVQQCFMFWESHNDGQLPHRWPHDRDALHRRPHDQESPHQRPLDYR